MSRAHVLFYVLKTLLRAYALFGFAEARLLKWNSGLEVGNLLHRVNGFGLNKDEWEKVLICLLYVVLAVGILSLNERCVASSCFIIPHLF